MASPLSEPQGWVGWAKSWGRYTAQALVSRAFGWSLLAGVPLTVAVQVGVHKRAKPLSSRDAACMLGGVQSRAPSGSGMQLPNVRPFRKHAGDAECTYEVLGAGWCLRWIDAI